MNQQSQWLAWRKGFSGPWNDTAHLSNGTLTLCGLLLSYNAVPAPDWIAHCKECERLERERSADQSDAQK